MSIVKTKEYFERLKNLHNEIHTLNLDLSALQDEMKDEIPDVSFADLSKMAKLAVTDKLGVTLDKMEKFTSLVDDLNS